MCILEKGDTYGYEILKLVSNETMGHFELKEGTMYISLKRLEKNKWIESYWKKVDNTPKRKYYRFTNLGNIELQKMKKEWTEIVSVMNNFITGN